MTRHGNNVRTRSSRLFSWAGWSLLAAIVIAVCGLIWVFTFGVDGKSADDKAKEDLRRAVESTKNALLESASDGQLTDAEITEATSRREGSGPAVVREPGRITFAVELHGVASGAFGSAGSSKCYSFTIPEPLKSAADIQAIEVPTCGS